MAAIVAAVAESASAGDVASALLDRLAFRGAHRAYIAEPGVAIGAITEDGGGGAWFGERLWVAADARLDNRDELMRELRLERCVDDAELLAHACETWPERWPERLLGDFAALIWDRRARELTLVRDPVGVRCLYWVRNSQEVRCATEMMPLVRTLSSARPDRSQMALFLVGRYDERDHTLVQGVHSVPPAHVVTLDCHGNARRRRYWYPGGRRSLCRSLGECAEEFRPVFRRAVEDRLGTSDRSIAIEISGGFDCTSVAATAAELLRKRPSPTLLGVTKVFPGLDCDESAYSRAFAAHVGLPLLEVDPRDAPEFLEPSFPAHASGDVYFQPNVAVTWSQLRQTHARGVRRILTGSGSDDLSRREPDAELIDAVRRHDFPQIRELLRGHGAPGVFLELILGARARSFVAREFLGRRGVLSARSARCVDDLLEERVAALRAHSNRDEVELRLVLGLQHGATLALANSDRMAAREHSHFAHPFLDRRVVETVLAMPPAFVAGRGPEVRKPLLRYAMRDLLPAEIRDRRTKTIFDSFVRAVLVERGRRLMQLVQRGLLREYGLLDERAVASLSDHVDVATNLWPLINCLSLEVWLRSLASAGENHGRV